MSSDPSHTTDTLDRDGEHDGLPVVTFTGQPDASQPEHFIVIVGQTHMRIYGSKEKEGGRAKYALSESLFLPDEDQSSTGQSNGAGSAPMPQPRSAVTELSKRLGQFLEDHREATWDYAAGPALHQMILNRLSPDALARLEVALVKELSHQEPSLHTDFVA